MEERILIRYGEIALKSKKVRKRFEMRLLHNIKNAIGREMRIRLDYGRLFTGKLTETKKENLKRVFGIVSFSECFSTKTDIDNILNLGLYVAKIIGKNDTFAVKTNRVGKHDFTSEDINKKLGAKIVEKFGNKVNLSNPDKTVFVEIRDNISYIYSDKIKGPGGLPVGVAGRTGILMENELSLIVTWIALKRGCEVVPIFVGKTNSKWLNQIKKWSYGIDLKTETIKDKEFDTLNEMRRKNSLLGLFTSETMKNASEFKKMKNSISVPIYRPLLCLHRDKIKHIKHLFIN